jgi:2-phosphosulfolactate phosphatase
VLRAFSVSYFIEAAHPTRYIVVDDVSVAFSLRKRYSDVILVGERQGIKIPGFDFGNSPTEILCQDFTGKTVVHTTTAGTKGLVRQPKTNLVAAGSFVNVSAIVRYVWNRGFDVVNIYCTANRGEGIGVEDHLFADYLKNELLGAYNDFAAVRCLIFEANSEAFSGTGFAPRTDLEHCLEADRFDSVLARTSSPLDSSLLELKRLN